MGKFDTKNWNQIRPQNSMAHAKARAAKILIGKGNKLIPTVTQSFL